jgi:uncharacterized protein
MEAKQLAEGLGAILWHPYPEPEMLRAWARSNLSWQAAKQLAFLNTTIRDINTRLFQPVTKMEIVYTEACNLACTYCFEGDKIRPRSMTKEVSRKAVDLLFDYCGDAGQVQITHFGGEPLLRWKLVKECIEYASQQALERGVAVHHQMTTNGTLITDEIAHFMRDHGLTPLISLDGLAASHDRHRRDRQGRPTFERVITGLQTIRKVHGWAGVKVTVTPESAPTLADDVRGIASLGANSFLIGHASGVSWAESDIDAFNAAMRSLFDWYQIHRSPSLKLHCFEEPHRKVPSFGCQAGVSSIAVLPTGEISSCSKIFGLDKRRPIDRLGDVWLGLYCLDQRREFHRCTKLRYHSRQMGVHDTYPGGCFANNFKEAGDLYVPSRLDARFAEARARFGAVTSTVA